MITSFNPENKIQFEKYSLLFAKAYKELAEKNKLTEREIDAGRFTSLDEYFGHMEDLINIDPTYTMLPIDDQAEGIFTIDANARTITIPPQFAKCAAVQSDELCEIAIFTIDRYYDYRDLDGVGICVQWSRRRRRISYPVKRFRDSSWKTSFWLAINIIDYSYSW